MKRKKAVKAMLFSILFALAALLVCGSPREPQSAQNRQNTQNTVEQPEQVFPFAVFVGEARQIPVSGAGSFSSSDPLIASVSAAGLVTAHKAGECTVTYTGADGRKRLYAVTVLEYSGPSTPNITVLMYHSILRVKGNILCVPKEDFEAEIKWLSENGYAALSLEALYDHMTNRVSFPEKSVVITLDDGYADNYVNAYPVLKKYNMCAAIFMISSKIGKDGYLTSAQIKEMSDSGLISVEGHTVTHSYLDTLTYDEQVAELRDSKAAIEKITGRTVRFMAYPTGRYNSDTLKAAKAAGYKMCFRMNGGRGGLDSPLLEFPRAFVGNRLEDFIKTVKTGQ